MITPGFFGFYNAHRGLIATQNALSTLNHNITNANTEGYSRQRVDLTAYTPYASPTPFQLTGGQLGQGPWVQQVTRVRDAFLDAQFRQSNGFYGLNSSIRDALQQVEGVLTEPSDSGINTALQNFFDAAQELSLHPETLSVRSDFVQQANDLLTVFQQQATQLNDIRKNLVGDPSVPNSLTTSQLAININDINTILQNIASLNQGIVSIKASGAQPNDLLDQRDKLLDDLSKLVDIEVTNYQNGQIDVNIAGQAMIHGAALVDTLQVQTNPNLPPGPPTPLQDEVPAFVSTVNGGVVLNDGAGAELGSGVLKGIVDMGSFNLPTVNITTVRGLLDNLNTLLTTVVNEVNAVQTAGRDYYGNTPAPALFTLAAGTSLNIFRYQVNNTIINDPYRLAAASGADPVGFAGIGDGRNALAIAQLRNLSPGLGTSYVDYFNGITSRLGIDSRSYVNTTASQNRLVQTIDQQRQSTSGVNIDEEMIDVLRYQRAFEATSKTIQIFDEVIQTIINLV